MKRKIRTLMMTLSIVLSLTSWRAFTSRAAAVYTGASQPAGVPFRVPAGAAGAFPSLAAAPPIMSGCATPDFSAATNFAVGTRPASVAVGDFNGDGKLDLATANFNSDNVSVLLNNCTANTAPIASCQNVTVAAGANCTATASINNGSSDPDGDTITLAQSPAGPYPLGLTTVTLTVTDSAGASNSCSATVTVVDQTAPIITLNGTNPLPVECANGFTDPGATALDNCSGTRTVTATNNINLNVPGSYTITYAASDGNGNTATKTRTVNVVDTKAPLLTLKANLTFWPPNHSYHTITISQMVRSVVDGCNTTLGISAVVIEKVTSDEPDNATGDADGNTPNDIVIAADCKSVQVRAERDETKNGRVYVLTLRVKDAAGNTTRKDFKVSVPINQSGAAALQGATAQTKTSSCP